MTQRDSMGTKSRPIYIYIYIYAFSKGKFRKTEIISNIFSNPNARRLEINYRKNFKNANTWRMNNVTKYPMDN